MKSEAKWSVWVWNPWNGDWLQMASRAWSWSLVNLSKRVGWAGTTSFLSSVNGLFCVLEAVRDPMISKFEQFGCKVTFVDVAK